MKPKPIITCICGKIRKEFYDTADLEKLKQEVKGGKK